MPNSDIRPIPGYNDRKLEKLYQNHSPLEAETTAYLKELGFLAVSAPYHKTMPPDVQKAIHSNFDISGNYIRGRADRILIHKDSGFICQIEFKSPSYYHQKPVLYIEAMPLALHIYHSRIGIPTLIVYRDPYRRQTAAFWADHNSISFIEEVRIPPKDKVNRTLYERKLRQLFGEYYTPPIRQLNYLSTRGSNDPYAVLNLETITRYSKDLKKLLDDAVFQYSCFNPKKPLQCNTCGQLVDFMKVEPCPHCNDEITLAMACNDCRGIFCNFHCYHLHLKGLLAKIDEEEDRQTGRKEIPLLMECSCGYKILQADHDPYIRELLALMDIHQRTYPSHTYNIRESTEEERQRMRRRYAEDDSFN